jgi:hypothetical protein
MAVHRSAVYTYLEDLMPNKRLRKLRAYACIGSHKKIYVTESSPHEATVGRLEVYLRKADALRNGSQVVAVTILYYA